MRKIELEVDDDDYSVVIKLLKNLSLVKVVSAEDKNVDETTLLSQASLAEDWNSPEDDRYDEIYSGSLTERLINNAEKNITTEKAIYYRNNKTVSYKEGSWSLSGKNIIKGHTGNISSVDKEEHSNEL